MWRLIRRRRGDEQGAVIVLMVGFAVALVGMAALVIDVGSILDEKAQLQNGADAGALAVAHSCAAGSCNTSLADNLANSNARDNNSTASTTTNGIARTVTVTDTTRTGTSTILPYSFGQALTGVQGRTHHATATAAWDFPSSALVLPFSISPCSKAGLEIGKATVIYVNSFSDCPTHQSPGGFGWLQLGCQTIVNAGSWIDVDNGRSGPACLKPLQNTIVLLPVTDSVRTKDPVTGKNVTQYHVIGFAALRLTGWEMPGDKSTPAIVCPSTTCIAGTFVNYVITTTTFGGGADFGVFAVFLKS